MNSTRFAQVQVYRGIAILLVVGFHVCVRWMPPKNAENLYPWNVFESTPNPFRFGYLGVNLFFIISGFVITQSVEYSKSIGEFWVKRVARIWPSLIFIIMTLFLISRIYHLKKNPGVDESFAALFSSLTLIDPQILQNFIPLFEKTTWLTGVLWSLSVELVFYLLISICYFCFKKIYLHGIFYLFLGIFLFNTIDLIKPEYFAQHITLESILTIRHYIFWFYIGMSSYKLVNGQEYNKIHFYIAYCLNVATETHRHSVEGITSQLNVMILITFFHLFFTQKALNLNSKNHISKVLGRIGDISYEIYLMHEFILLALLSVPELHNIGNYSTLILIPYFVGIIVLSFQIKNRFSDKLSFKIREFASD